MEIPKQYDFQCFLIAIEKIRASREAIFPLQLEVNRNFQIWPAEGDPPQMWVSVYLFWNMYFYKQISVYL